MTKYNIFAHHPVFFTIYYDYERLTIGKTTKEEPFHVTYDNAMEAIGSLREKFGGSTLFGNEKDDSFKSSIGQIYQTFGGEELYPSVEEKAAMLLYLVTKNHSFSDGNKRIAATLFLWLFSTTTASSITLTAASALQTAPS